MQHYALSELVLLGCTLNGIWRFRNLNHRIASQCGMFALALLGATAVLGASRYGMDRIEELAGTHRSFLEAFRNGGPILLAALFLVPLTETRDRWQFRILTMFAVFAALLLIVGMDKVLQATISDALRWHLFHLSLGAWVLGLAHAVEQLEETPPQTVQSK